MLNPRDDKNEWFFQDIGGMVGSYIAALTAVSVTNLRFLPSLFQWPWPTIVIVPIMSFVIRKYKIKFATGKRPADVSEVKLALLPE